MALDSFTGKKYIVFNDAAYIYSGRITSTQIADISSRVGLQYTAVLGYYFYQGVVNSELCNALRRALNDVAYIYYETDDETEEVTVTNSYISWLQLAKDQQYVKVLIPGTVLTGTVDATLLTTLRASLSYDITQYQDVPDYSSDGGSPGSPFDLTGWCDQYRGEEVFITCSASLDTGVSGTVLRDAVLARGARTNFAYSLSPSTWAFVNSSSDEVLKSAVMAYDGTAMSVMVNVRGIIGELPRYSVASAEITLPYVLAARNGNIVQGIIGKNLFIAIGATKLEGSAWNSATSLTGTWHALFSTKDLIVNDFGQKISITRLNGFNRLNRFEALVAGYDDLQAYYHVKTGWDAFAACIELDTTTVPGGDPDPESNTLVTEVWETLVTDGNEPLVATP